MHCLNHLLEGCSEHLLILLLRIHSLFFGYNIYFPLGKLFHLCSWAMWFDELNPTASLKQQAYFLSQATVIGWAHDSTSGNVLKLFWEKLSHFPTGSKWWSILEAILEATTRERLPGYGANPPNWKQGNLVLVTFDSWVIHLKRVNFWTLTLHKQVNLLYIYITFLCNVIQMKTFGLVILSIPTKIILIHSKHFIIVSD